jgi:hypothetical protein
VASVGHSPGHVSNVYGLADVVGDWGPTTPVGLDVIDLGVSGSGVVDIGYALAGRRVGRLDVICFVFGDVEPAPPPGLIV